MKWTAADWHFLRTPVLTLLATLLLGSALVYFTYQQFNLYRGVHKQQQDDLRKASSRLHESGDERDRILRYRADFLDLQQRGFIGEEQRINWVDALRAANLQLKMFGVSYQIEAQQAYQSPVAMDAGPYHLRQSVMKINMGLLHEEDLPRFMAALAEMKAGVFAVKECNIQRSGAARNDIAGMQPHLNADCSLVWLTISEGKGGERP